MLRNHDIIRNEKIYDCKAQFKNVRFELELGRQFGGGEPTVTALALHTRKIVCDRTLANISPRKKKS